MTALACPQCQKEVPQQSSRCPSCGFELWSAAGAEPRRKKPTWVWWLVGLGALGLLGVIVLGLLATLVVPNVLQRFQMASRKKAAVDIAALENALEEYAINNAGRYPDRIEALVTLDINGHSYLKQTRVPRDPWHREYLYEPPGPTRDRPRVYSLGKDGRPGGRGGNADIEGFLVPSRK